MLIYQKLTLAKDADRIANSVDPDKSLIWEYTVCPDLSVRKLRIITVGQLIFKSGESETPIQQQEFVTDQRFSNDCYYYSHKENLSVCPCICLSFYLLVSWVCLTEYTQKGKHRKNSNQRNSHSVLQSEVNVKDKYFQIK